MWPAPSGRARARVAAMFEGNTDASDLSSQRVDVWCHARDDAHSGRKPEMTSPVSVVDCSEVLRIVQSAGASVAAGGVDGVRAMWRAASESERLGAARVALARATQMVR